MTLRTAAKAVLDRWDSPQWEWAKHGPTADLMRDLRAALAQPAAPDAQPLFWYRPCRDGLYEGPHHHNSVGGKMLRDEKPGEWKPLYAAAPSEPMQTFEAWQQGFDAGYQQGIGAPPAPQPLTIDDAAEAMRKRFVKLQRYSFHIDGAGGVRQVPERYGNWVEFSEAHELFDPVMVDAALKAAGLSVKAPAVATRLPAHELVTMYAESPSSDDEMIEFAREVETACAAAWGVNLAAAGITAAPTTDKEQG